jgi:hypothetical protein
VRRFGAKISGLSRAQVTRLSGRWMKHHQIEKRLAQRPCFARRYTARRRGAAGRDRYGARGSGRAAIRHILHREFVVYGKATYERLAEISVSHLYNLRHLGRYRHGCVRVQGSITSNAVDAVTQRQMMGCVETGAGGDAVAVSVSHFEGIKHFV